MAAFFHFSHSLFSSIQSDSVLELQEMYERIGSEDEGFKSLDLLFL